MTPRNETALSRKTAPEPAAATTSPPSAGPAARATLKPTELSETAAGTSAFGTSSGTIAPQAGPFKALPKPRRKVKANKSSGEIR
jgi:hypothetical protein